MELQDFGILQPEITMDTDFLVILMWALLIAGFGQLVRDRIAFQKAKREVDDFETEMIEAAKEAIQSGLLKRPLSVIEKGRGKILVMDHGNHKFFELTCPEADKQETSEVVKMMGDLVRRINTLPT